MSSFYHKFIKNSKKGYSLKGGPLAKWRFPLNRVLYKKRLDAGPEPERPRSVWSNWNYESELYAFGKRLNEDFNKLLIRQAFVNPGYALAEKSKLEELGIQYDATENNTELAYEGKNICENYLQAIFNFWYPSLPQEGIEAITEYLLDTQKLALIARNIGAVDLVKTEEFPVHEKTLETCLYAIIGVLGRSKDNIKAHLFVNDFILTELIGKDINEIWSIKNPMGLLTQILAKSGKTSLPKSRLIWSTGATNPTAVFIVGLYVDEQYLSKGAGETVDIAEEMAARDALRRLFGTTEDAAPIPYGEQARKYSLIINSIYEKIRNQKSLQ